MHLATGVRARGMLIFVSNDAQTFVLMTEIRPTISHVQDPCTLAAASSQAPASRTNTVLLTLLNCTDASRYYFCSSRTNCNKAYPLPCFSRTILRYNALQYKLITFRTEQRCAKLLS